MRLAFSRRALLHLLWWEATFGCQEGRGKGGQLEEIGLASVGRGVGAGAAPLFQKAGYTPEPPAPVGAFLTS